MRPTTLKRNLATTIIEAAATLPFQETMWQLYRLYYQVEAGTFFERFKKNDYYALYTKGEEIIGFTGIRIKTIETAYGKCQTLYIGQTVMHSDFRGKSLIPRTCCRLLIRHFLRHPGRPVYVWCDALTYKPYLLFANSQKKFYPSRQEPTPAKVKAVIDQLGHFYYGADYQPETGTVRKQTNIINDPSTLITEKDRLHPDIDFFARVNPGYENGSGLITLAPINLCNFLFLIRKCLKKRFGK